MFKNFKMGKIEKNGQRQPYSGGRCLWLYWIHAAQQVKQLKEFHLWKCESSVAILMWSLGEREIFYVQDFWEDDQTISANATSTGSPRIEVYSHSADVVNHFTGVAWHRFQRRASFTRCQRRLGNGQLMPQQLFGSLDLFPTAKSSARIGIAQIALRWTEGENAAFMEKISIQQSTVMP